MKNAIPKNLFLAAAAAGAAVSLPLRAAEKKLAAGKRRPAPLQARKNAR